jgi:hypothetical protein
MEAVEIPPGDLQTSLRVLATEHAAPLAVEPEPAPIPHRAGRHGGGRPVTNKSAKSQRRRERYLREKAARAGQAPAPSTFAPAPAVPPALDEARRARVATLQSAMFVSGNLAISALALAPPLTEAQANVLAEAWEPVLAQYVGSSPWGAALTATVMVCGPYAAQYYMRERQRKAERVGAIPESTQ